MRALAGVTAVCLVAVHARAARAQQATIPIRPLGAIIATSTQTLPSVWQIRPLHDGRVLVNDLQGQRLVLFDSSLKTFKAVADTTSGTSKAYGNQAGLLAYWGDSSILADPRSLAFLVVDPNGKINRVISAPKGNGGGLGYTVIPDYGAVFDGMGRVMSKWPPAVGGMPGPGASSPAPGLPLPMPTFADSGPIVRIDIASKKADTAAWLKASVTLVTPMAVAGGTFFRRRNDPLPTLDDWTVMSDGTVAVVRERTYHVDWISPDGKTIASPNIQHTWERLTDSMKVAMLDSARTADSIVTAARIDSAKKAAAKGGNTDNGPFAQITLTQAPWIDASDMPDYWPPFTGVGNVKADADGNIWIKVFQTKPLPGGPVYDVVNREGKLIDRVQIPGATTLVGFGPGVAYLTSREGTGVALARARIH